MAAQNFDYDHDVDAEQTPIADRKDKEFTLYVNNIPPELNEIAIRQLFSDYGRITDLILRKGWAYITYGSFREAEHASRDLNNAKPLQLQITVLRKPTSSKKEDDTVPFTGSSNAIQQQNQTSSYDVAESLSACNDAIFTKKINRAQPFDALRKHNLLPQGAENIRDDRSLSPNDREFEKFLLNSSKLWTRGSITVTPDGKRHVSLGRGYVSYVFPEENPMLEKLIDKEYERRNSGYEYTKDKPPCSINSCYLCSTKTIQHCAKCYTYYCSQACQVKDWPRHRAECDRIPPPLVEETINDMSALRIREKNQTQQITQSSTSSKTITPQSSASNNTVTAQSTISSNVRLRRPNISSTTQTENTNDTVNINTNKYNIGLSNNGDDQDRHLSFHGTNNINESQTKRDYQLSNGTNNRNSLQNRFKYSDENIDQTRKNGSSGTSSPQHQRNTNRGYQANKRNANKENFDNDDGARGRNQFYQRNGNQNNESASYNGRETVKQENNAFTVSRNTDYLSDKNFTDVEITISLGNNEYWICKNVQARANLMTKLEHLAVKSRNLKPIVGSVYGVLYENIWQRALVKSLSPVKVHYIDYGNDEILRGDTIFKDIRDLLKEPGFAQKIRVMPNANRPGKNLQYGNTISVRLLSVDDDDTMVVEVKETPEDSSHATKNIAQSNINITTKEPASQMNVQASPVKKFASQDNLQALPSNNKKSASQESLSASANTITKACKPSNISDVLMNLLAKEEASDTKGIIEISESETESNICSGFLCTQDFTNEVGLLLESLQIDCEQMQDYMNYKPQADELICGKESSIDKGDTWYRGYIHLEDSTSSGMYMRSIDKPRIIEVQRVVPCPKIYQNIPVFGVTCILEKPSQYKLRVGDFCEFEAVANKYAQQLKVNLTINDITEVVSAVIKPWSHNRAEVIEVAPTVQHFELTSGTKVCLTSFENHYTVFARSLDDEEVKHFNDLMLRVAKYAQTAPFLIKPPHVNQVVIAPYIDNNYYRAMVLDLKENKVWIQYTDFGNIHVVKRQELKVISDELARERSCTTKVLLKDVPRDVAITNEARIYLQDLTDKEVPLTCTHTLYEEGVYLVTATAERINEKIKELLLPNTNDAKYTLSDIKVAKLGSVGAVVKAVAMCVLKQGVSYMLAPDDNSLFNQLAELAPQIAEHCKTTKYYVPKENELCLALYEEEWYRAVCINPKESQTTAKIFFFDYGNTEIIEHQKIREMHKDFLKLPILATECKVINLVPLDNTGSPSIAVQQKLIEFTNNYKPIQIKIIKIFENVATIELPEIRKKLIESGLVS